jgi:hypothetical protein
MEALGILSPIEDARAAVQNKIAQFLSGRTRLMNLMKSKSLQIQSEAKGLYNVQLSLENQLTNEINPKLQAIQQGVWNFSDIALLGGFAGIVAKHINDVNKLEVKGGGVKADVVDFSSLGMGIPALVIVGLLGGYLLTRR